MTPPSISDAELERHILDCGRQIESATARTGEGDPHARDEAVQWWHLMREAIAERDRRSGAARHAQFEAALEGMTA